MNPIHPPRLVLALLALAALACNTLTGPVAGPKPLTPTPPRATRAATEVVEPTEPTEADEASATPPAPTGTPVAPSDTPEPTPEPVQAYFGDVIEADGIALAALQVADPAPPGSLFQPQAGYRLVAVEVIQGSLTHERFAAGPLTLTLLDAEGFTYQADLLAQDAQVLPSLTLGLGERVRGWAAFQVPEAAVLAALRVALPDGAGTLQTTLAPRPEGAAPLTGTPYTPPDDLPALGVETEAGGYTLSAAALEDPAPAGLFYTPVEGRKLVAVDIILGNVSGAALTVNPVFAFLVDAEGYVYPGRLFGRDGTIESVTLQPGDKVRGWVSFELPDSATPAAVRYTFDLFSGLSILTGLNAP